MKKYTKDDLYEGVEMLKTIGDEYGSEAIASALGFDTTDFALMLTATLGLDNGATFGAGLLTGVFIASGLTVDELRQNVLDSEVADFVPTKI